MTETHLLQITAKSGNTKTGPMPTTMRPESTCPSTCPFLPSGEIGGCYGTGRIMAMADTLSGYMTEDQAVAKASKGKAKDARWMRDRVVGDIVTADGAIDHAYVRFIARVAKRLDLKPFGYTHAMDRITRADVRKINATGYVLNASTETAEGAARAVSLGMPTTIANDDIPEGTIIAGKRVVTCPAQTRDGVSCATCGLCAKPQRAAIVRFRIHGTAARKARAAVHQAEEREEVS